MMKFRHLAIGVLAFLGACATPPDTSKVVVEDSTVKASRTAMVGMSEADVRMCAGFPTYGVKITDAEKIWTYQRIYARGTVSVGASTLAVGPTPAITGGTGIGAPGFCYTQIRFVDGHVTQIEFAGDNNTATSINGLCVSTVDRCVVYAKQYKTTIPVAKTEPVQTPVPTAATVPVKPAQ